MGSHRSWLASRVATGLLTGPGADTGAGFGYPRGMRRLVILLTLVLAPATTPAPRRLEPMAVAEVAAARGLSMKQVRALHRVRGLELAVIRELSPRALAAALAKAARPKAAYPGEAFAYRLMTEVDETGVLPRGARAAALRARAAAGGAPATVAGVPTGGPGWLAPPVPGGGRWRWLGPGNIGGRTRALVIHPGDPRIAYAGSAGGGVWQSRDAGASWRPLDDLLPSLTVAALAFDPGDPRVLYAGTGEGFFRGRGVPGEGIFVTRDGGRRFRHLPATDEARFTFVNRLALTADSAALLAACSGGLMVSRDQGASWRAALEAETLDVDCHPTDPRRCVAAGSAGEVHVTQDGGATWSAAAGLPPITQPDGYQRVEVCYAAADPRVVYASVDSDGGRILRSSDGGRHFTAQDTALRGSAPAEPVRYLGGQGWYDNVIWAGLPDDPDTVVVGGIDLWRSRDRGARLQRISRWQDSPESAHADHHVITLRPGSRREVYFGNDGGVYRAADVTAVAETEGWQVRNTNYGVTQFYRAARSLLSGTLVGGTQDNGTLRYSPGEGVHAWKEMLGGDGGYCAWDPVHPDVYYGEYIWLMMYRSDDEGRSADFICGVHWDGEGISWKAEPYLIPEVRDRLANFIAPFMLDPSDPDRLVGGAHGVWLSEDPRAPNTPTTGPRWRRIAPGLGAPRERNFVSCLGMQAARPGELWVGHNRGEIRVSRAAFGDAPRFERVDRDVMPRRPVLSVLASPHDPERVYVTYGGYDAGGVWTSPDSGRSWMDLSAGLPGVPVRSLLVHPENPRWLYLGTSVGIFVSDDAGATWWPGSRGPTTSPVDQLLWDQTQVGPARRPALLAVTHGRGIWALEME